MIDLHTDELYRPPLVQSFRAWQPDGRLRRVYIGERNFERLDVSQLARLKMPRIQWTPQYGVVEKSVNTVITEDDGSDSLPIQPRRWWAASLLYPAEEAYDNLAASPAGLEVGKL